VKGRRIQIKMLRVPSGAVIESKFAMRSVELSFPRAAWD